MQPAKPHWNLLSQLTEEAYASDYPPAAQRARISGRWWVSSVAVAALVTLLITASLTSARLLAPQQRAQQASLVARVEALRADVVRTAGENRRTTVELAALARDQLAESSQGRQLLRSLRIAEAAAGASAVAGPGVCLTVRRKPGVTPAFTDRDLQQLINRVWLQGAAAVAVNGIRLTSTTAVRTAGDAILVAYRPINWPYRVCAVSADPPGRQLTTTTFESLLRRLDREHAVESQAESLRVAAPAARVND
ncbi:MAG: DUF881 domain-containing protein [Actinomycetales bacterium]|nr:DUF881 domain-containing protein [Actinomycetales bacterium]